MNFLQSLLLTGKRLSVELIYIANDFVAKAPLLPTFLLLLLSFVTRFNLKQPEVKSIPSSPFPSPNSDRRHWAATVQSSSGLISKRLSDVISIRRTALEVFCHRWYLRQNQNLSVKSCTNNICLLIDALSQTLIATRETREHFAQIFSSQIKPRKSFEGNDGGIDISRVLTNQEKVIGVEIHGPGAQICAVASPWDCAKSSLIDDEHHRTICMTRQRGPESRL